MIRAIVLITLVSLVVAQVALDAEAGKKHGGKKHDYDDGMVKSSSPPHLHCPKGFETIGHHKNIQCIRHIESPPLPACTHGGVLDHNGKCRVIAPTEFVCPPGFAAVDSGKKHGGHHKNKKHGHDDDLICAMVKSAPAIHHCPDGSPAPNGMCSWTATSPAHFECPGQGEKKHKKHGNDSCMTLREIPPIPICPPATVYQKGMCVGERPAPCPPQPSKKGYHGGHAQTSHGHSTHGHSTHGHENYDQGIPPFDDGYAFDVENASYGQEHEYFERVENTIAVRRLGRKNKHGSNFLPPPFPSKKMCTAPVTMPPAFECPPESISAGGKKYHGGKKHGNDLNCAIAVPLPPVPLCLTPGAVLSQDGQTCLSNGLEPALVKCPQGFSPCGGGKKHGGGGGGKHGGNGGGKKHGDGFDDITNCCAHKSAPPVPMCPKGFTLEGTVCVGYTHPQYICKSGMLKHDMCVLKESIPPIVEYTVTKKSHTPAIISKK